MRLSCGTLTAVAFASFLAFAGEARATVDEAARALLPPDVAQRGTLEVATSFNFAPYIYLTEGNEVTGLDATVARAVAERLGLKAVLHDLKLAVMLSGVDTGRYDFAIGQMGVNAERLLRYDFAIYMKSNYGLMVPAGNTPVDPADLCGRHLGVSAGSAQVMVMERLSATCVAAGKAALKKTEYPDQSGTVLAVANKRVEGWLITRAMAHWIASNSPKIAVAEGVVPGAFNMAGLLTNKDNAALTAALRAALQSLYQDGTLPAILAEYGIADGALSADDLARAPADHLPQ